MLAKTTNSAAARKTILASIRQNLASSLLFDAVHHEHHAHQQKTSVVLEESSFVENLQIVKTPNPADITLAENFRKALVSVGGNCRIVSNVTEAAQIIQEIIEEKKPNKIAVTNSILAQNVVALFETTSQILTKAAAAELFDCDLGITGAQWAIAETGTLVLESDAEYHRLTSLVPPVHVAIIEERYVRQSLGEILEILNQNDAGNLSRTITLITGPSRTSDIELTLAIGVHGPAELHVIVVSNENYG